MSGRAAVIVVVIAVIAVAIMSLGLDQRLPGSIGSSGESGPIYVKVLSVENGVEAVKAKIKEINGVESWALYYVRPGLTGYLIKTSVENKGDETYVVDLVLITSEDRLIRLPDHWRMGIASDIISTGIASEEQKQMLEKAREYPKEMILAMSFPNALKLTPGASTEQVLLYGLQPGEKPLKLHVTAKSPSGPVVEFDIPIKS